MFSKSIDPIGHKVILLDIIHSTNAFLAAIVSQKHVKHGTIVRAKHQYAGKGQLNKQWISEENLNLTCSILLKPDKWFARDQFLLSVITSLALRATISEHVLNCTIKWPNDIYVNDQKICGVLIQNALMKDLIQHSIIGVGVNVNQTNFDKDLPNPTSLKLEIKEDFDIDTLLIQFCMVFEQFYQQVLLGNIDHVWKAYESHLYRYHTECVFQDRKGAQMIGKIMGVEPDGKLQILQNNSLNSYSLHEISMLI